MKLYGSLMSPFVRMSMVTAMECGLSSRVQLLPAPVKPDEVNKELAKLSAIGKVPVLETDHGHPIYDSRVIMEYFAHVAGNKHLLPDDGVKRFRVLTLLALSQGMADASVALRYETATRPEASRWPAFAERTQARLADCLDMLESDWHADLQDVTLGSIATAAALGYIEVRDIVPGWRKNHANLSQFADRFAKRESMMNTTPKA
jgi:glutathione S-transferase